MEVQQQYETVSKFDRQFGGLLGGNQITVKPTTVEEVNNITGEAETFIIQTIRDEKGDHVVVKFLDKNGPVRLILPPKVVGVIFRQCDSLTKRSRSARAKLSMKERMANGFKPTFAKKSGGSR